MIDLYSLATPNGQKVSIALEEMGLSYTPHTIDITKGDQFKPEFLAVNPNSKIPAIVDQDGPGGKPLAVFESGAILVYLAKKSGMFLSKDPRLESETLQWLFFQVGGIGPMFGQFGHFYKYAADKCEHPYPVERYKTESKRLLKVLDTHLGGGSGAQANTAKTAPNAPNAPSERKFLVGEEYSIADMATMPWVHCLSVFYGASDVLELESFPHVRAWVARCLERPKTAAGMKICGI